ncbi:YobI family P-loop NTPase [Sphingobacterium multivorum]|uniref:YobI family P-loop NTPase n=1 Tax=Sphingobacterium multivorum TaxID=28454 RepID=UPI0028A9BEA6|nr:hypothetical protein [Sphingobacterium multivorum]
MKIPLLDLFIPKKEEPKNNTLVSSLAPKILTKEEDLEKIQPYLDKLKETIDTKGINNIALTGGYGSGKSTILKTFQHLNPQYKYLNISLASFNKKKDEGEETIPPKDKKIQKEELERLLEVSILQQIFYHVKPAQIPESRFKRIINIPNWKIWLISVGFILWISSSIILLKYNYLDKINPKNWDRSHDFDLFSLFTFLIAFIGLGLFSKLVIRLFSNSKINKVNIKGELELGDNVNKSVFNEHLEEILYFFERTKFDVVIIEDLDRFDSTDIFTKIREINILLNTCRPIGREINFIYAVGDDLFEDKKERVKFFEYIIPVIPFINSSNADEQLRKLVNESGLNENIFTKEFISDVTTFIDDIDMRLLTNIFHEFVIYRKTLKPEFVKKNDELFAMITYKNIDPKDFTLLNKKEGKLYELITNKKIYVKESIDKMDMEIQEKSSEIKNIESQTLNDIKELRSIYVNTILSKLPEDSVIEYSTGNLLEDDGFESLMNEGLTYGTLTFNSYYNLYSKSSHKLAFSFTEIENEVNPDYTYAERAELLEHKQNNKIDLLKNEIEKLRRRKSDTENKDLKQIFDDIDLNQYLDKFSNNKLLRNLILNGYINENFNDYISLFHEVSITKADFTFERNVKSGYATEFNYKLSDRIGNLIDKIDDRYFNREAILNMDLLDYLGANYNRYSDKYDAVVRLLSNEKEKSIKFIDEYINDEKRPKAIFIEKLVENWKGFWDYLVNKSSYEKSHIYNYLRVTLIYAKTETILKNQNKQVLNELVSGYPQFLSLVRAVDGTDFFVKISGFLKELGTKFEKLDDPNEESKKLFDYVYNNNHYQINKENVLQMLVLFGAEGQEQNFHRSNYSTIIKSNCKPLIGYINSNIDSYVENVYLKLEDNNFEEEEYLNNLLNNKNLHGKLKSRIIQKVETIVQDLDKINELEIKAQLLTHNRVAPKWSNVTNYYTVSGNTINENLIIFLEFEIVREHLSKVRLLKEDEDFEINLIKAEELSDNTYNDLLDSIYHTWNRIDFQHLSEEKAIALLKKKLNVTKDNYDLLREHFPNNHITLIEKNFGKFIENIDDFETDTDDVILLLKSDKITDDNKFQYISKLDENVIADNKEISGIVGKAILRKSSAIPLNVETLKTIVSNSHSEENKIKLLNLYFDNLSEEAVIRTLSDIWGYDKLFKNGKPTYTKNEYNGILLGKLKAKGLIKKYYDDSWNDTKYRVTTKY